jgi:hypothetical protein
MIKPVRIQRKRTKGFNLQAASPNGLPVVYVGRPTKWGNRFKREHYGWKGAVIRYLDEVPVDLEEIRGKNLACWCPLDRACHADVLLELANKEVSDDD